MDSETGLPRNWPKHVRSALVHVASLAHTALIYTRSWCADSQIQRVKLTGQLNQARNEVALLREEIRIKDGRMAKISPHHRPFYPPTERMAILELKAMRGWNLAQCATAFQVEPETIVSWMRRLDEDGKDALVRLPEPVNRFPAFVRYLVQRLKVLCPIMGRKKIAEVLARVGLHLSASSVSRFLKNNDPHPLSDKPASRQPVNSGRAVTAGYANHVWHVDLTVVPTSAGFWTAVFPFTLLQVWPFCWWVAVIVDHFSRKALGFAVFRKQPTSREVCSFLGRATNANSAKPKHIINDRGKQFDCGNYRKWAKRKKIRLRFGAIGKYGSISVIERFIRTMKDEYLRRGLVPFALAGMREQLTIYFDWYNGSRPHEYLNGRTPNEVYSCQFPANRKPRYEPRTHWPPGSPCAAPVTLVKGKTGIRLGIDVSFVDSQHRLPVVELRKVA